MRFWPVTLVAAGVFLAAGTGSAVIVLVQSNNATSPNNSATSLSSTFTSTPTVGNLLVAIASAGSASTNSYTINAPSGWSTAINQTGSTAAAPSQAIFYKVAGALEPTTVTFTITGGTASLGLQIFEYSGLAATAPLDGTSSGFSNAVSQTSGNTGTPLTTATNDLLVAGITIGNTETNVTETNSFTERFDFNAGGGVTDHFTSADRRPTSRKR